MLANKDIENTSPEYIWLFGLLTAYLGTRVPRLVSVPIFLDEAIHIEHAKAAIAGDLTAGGGLGKWLAIQSYGLFLGLFDASLFCARLVPVVLGLITVFLLFALGRTSRDRDGTISGGFSALLYIIVPYALFYDRVALTDEFLTVLLASIFLFTYRITEKPTLLDQVLLGAVIMLSPLFKFNGLLFVLVPIIITIAVAKREERLRQLRNLVLPYALSMPVVLLFCLFAAPTGEAGKLSDFHSVNAWLQLVAQNFKDTLVLSWSMLTPALLLGLVVGSIALVILSTQQVSRRRVLAGVVVLIVLTAPYVLLFRVWYPRYYLPLLVPLCAIGGEVSHFVLSFAGTRLKSVASLLSRSTLLVVIVLLSIQSIRLCVLPLNFPFPKKIEGQFFTRWTSGYGLNNAVEAIHLLSSQNPDGVRILRSPRWDIPLQGLDVYFRKLGTNTQRMTLQPWEPDGVLSQLSAILTDGKPTYLLFNGAYFYHGDRKVIDSIRACFDVQEVGHFGKPDENPGLRLWRLNKRPAGLGGDQDGE